MSQIVARYFKQKNIMKSITMILTLTLAGITFSCGGGEKGKDGDSTKVAGGEKSTECPASLAELEKVTADYKALVEKAKAGEDVTAAAGELGATQGKLGFELVKTELAEPCNEKFKTLSADWGKAVEEMATASVK
jgi:hypothetical protein